MPDHPVKKIQFTLKLPDDQADKFRILTYGRFSFFGEFRPIAESQNI
jgi:hypothetical protein